MNEHINPEDIEPGDLVTIRDTEHPSWELKGIVSSTRSLWGVYDLTIGKTDVSLCLDDDEETLYVAARETPTVTPAIEQAAIALKREFFSVPPESTKSVARKVFEAGLWDIERMSASVHESVCPRGTDTREHFQNHARCRTSVDTLVRHLLGAPVNP